MRAFIGFEVGGRRFRVEAPPEAEDYVTTYLGAFAGSGASAIGRLLLEWEGEIRPAGAADLTTQDGEVLGWGLADGPDLRVGMREPGSVGRGIALLISRAFRPPRFVLVHGAGLRVGANALVALGVSGAGKSTLSTLFEEADLLSDETLVLENAPEPLVHATPVRSSSPRSISTGSARLRAILALEKSPDVRLEPLGATQALTLLLEQALTHEPTDLPAQFELASSLVSRVQRRTLHFRKDRDFVPLLVELLR